MKLFIPIIFALISYTVHAQVTTSIGTHVGPTWSNQTWVHPLSVGDTIVRNYRLGYNAGGFIQVNFSERFVLQAGIGHHQKGFMEKEYVDIPGQQGQKLLKTDNYIDYTSFSINARYAFTNGRWQPYGLIGLMHNVRTGKASSPIYGIYFSNFNPWLENLTYGGGVVFKSKQLSVYLQAQQHIELMPAYKREGLVINHNAYGIRTGIIYHDLTGLLRKLRSF